MPTYNYICLACDKKFSIFQSMNDKSISNCKYCKSKRIEKIITGGSGLIFRGSGFYLTDYKNNTDNKKNKSKE
tara:strand:+ start:762 stop:980 length:219 start_codon:yes stop_codon:yes gene_type:complete